MKSTLYFGPPKDFYEPKRFNDFALIDVPIKLIEMGRRNECNTEGYGKVDPSTAKPEEGITYHYPNAGIGLFYLLIRPDRCQVNLMGTSARSSEMDEIMEFIFEQDNK